MKKILSILICMLILPMITATCYKYEPIRLMNGWNGVSLITDYTLTNQDINLTLVSGYNFLGYSAIDKTNLNNLKFYDVSGTEKTYQEALTSNWITEIDFANSTLTTGGDSGSKLSTYVGYWVYSNDAVKMTIPNVNGESVGNTINWTDLRFSNGIEELNITEAGNVTNGWITSMNYWGWDDGEEEYGWITLGYGDDLTPWIGYFIKSTKDNIYLLTNNETTKCKTKIKLKAKKSKSKINIQSLKSKLKVKLNINHLIRLGGN